MAQYQTDIFGKEISVDEMNYSSHKKKGRSTIKSRFRSVYGVDYEHKCGDCKHCIAESWNYKNYYKCEIMGITSSEATDIRLKDYACTRWEER